jgi:GDP-D-mannose dehydratase
MYELLTTTQKKLIFEITGQNGGCLTDFLILREHEIHGIKRSAFGFSEILLTTV